MDSTIPSLRAFNRFYTKFSGALDQRFLGSALSLAEGRLLYEIATRDRPVAIDLQQVIGLDAGYASRMLRKFEAHGWIERGRGEDARRRPISLTAAGREMFADLDKRQRDVLEHRVAPLAEADRRVLVAALDTARGLLTSGEAAGYHVRTFRAGDMGMITARQAILYNESHGWAAPMEALLGDVTSAFLRDYREGREQCWIAESAGVMAGLDLRGGCRRRRRPAPAAPLSSPGRAAWASAPTWSTAASPSRARRAIRPCASGPTACCSARGASMQAPGSRS